MVTAIRAAVVEAGRSIDDDHYGAGFPYYFGKPDDPPLQRAMDAYRQRTKRDPLGQFAIGDADAILARIAEYVAAGVSKFVLRPSVQGDDAVLAQTRRLIDEVLPRVASRWPRAAKAAAQEADRRRRAE